MINIAPISAFPKAVRPAAQSYTKAASALDALGSSMGSIDSDSAKGIAEAQDRRDMLLAIQAGRDPITVGQPAEMARRARVAATQQAIEASRVEVGRLQYELAELMLAHRVEIIEAARVALPAAAERYRTAVDNVLAARVAYEDCLQLRMYAAAIKAGAGVPSFAAGEQSSFVFDDYGMRLAPDELRHRLLLDAARHDGLDAAEAVRSVREERDRRIDAEIAAAAATRKVKEDAEYQAMLAASIPPRAA